MKIDYFLALEDYLHNSLSEFSDVLKAFPKKRVGSITIEELCSIYEYPNGFYLFFDDEDNLLFIGKAASRSFIEMIPANFDQREEAWFNALPKKLMKDESLENFRDALNQSLLFRLVLVGVKDQPNISKVVKVLRSYMQPLYNPRKEEHLSTDLLERFVD